MAKWVEVRSLISSQSPRNNKRQSRISTQKHKNQNTNYQNHSPCVVVHLIKLIHFGIVEMNMSARVRVRANVKTAQRGRCTVQSSGIFIALHQDSVCHPSSNHFGKYIPCRFAVELSRSRDVHRIMRLWTELAQRNEKRNPADYHKDSQSH